MRLLIAFVALLIGAGSARALESTLSVTKRATASLVSESDAVAVGTPFRVALRLRLAPGWHTYWRNPGDAGIPPELHFTLPDGVGAGPVVWPAPQPQPEGPLMSYGYQGQLLLATTISGAAIGKDATTPVRLHASWLVCAQICVPEEADFRLDLPLGTPGASALAGLFAEADAQAPTPSPWLAEISPDGRLRLTGQGIGAMRLTEARFFPDPPGTIVDAAAQRLSTGGDSLSIGLSLGAGFVPGAPLTGVLVLHDADGRARAVQIAAAPVAAGTPLLGLIGFAFLGGLVLNLMPCVFPILAIKAIGLAGLAGQPRRQAWGHAVAYAVGVLATFSFVAFALLAVRAAGGPAGWGFQFQSPVFVSGMAMLLFAVGLNLSGVYAVGGPMGAGQALTERGGLVGSFFTGLLAVLVATPCTAPFMATAVAAGLAGSAGLTLAVFLAMGAGLATPYVLLAMLPGVARLWPRPGRWMEWLRQALAFPVYAAAVWLVWVLSQEAGAAGVLAVGAGIVLLGFAGWALGLAQGLRPGSGRRVGFALAGLGALAAMATLTGVTVAPAAVAAMEPGTEPFSVTRLAEAQAAGHPVFVNLTAAWCVTCLVNERVALASDGIRRDFAARGVVYLKGDWTRQDPEITRFLHAHGREGVPYYALFPAAGGPPVELPQLLTESEVRAALAG